MGKITKKPPILTQYRVYPDDLLEWMGRNPDQKLLSAMGITPRQWALWTSTSAGTWISAAHYRMIRFHHRLHLAELLGPEWDGFVIHGNTMEFPGLKRPVSAGELRALWLQIQQVAGGNATISRLTRENERLTAELDEAERRAAYYRQQLRLESKMGMMLSHISS